MQSILRIEQNTLHDRTNTFFRLSKQLQFNDDHNEAVEILRLRCAGVG